MNKRTVAVNDTRQAMPVVEDAAKPTKAEEKKKIKMTAITKMTNAEWQGEGIRRFGEDRMQWKFICPSCGAVMSVQDYQDAGAPEGAVAFNCIGRYTGAARTILSPGEGPCNYAGGGLFQLNPIDIEGMRYFAFADIEDGA
jgi:hypothetical protein